MKKTNLLSMAFSLLFVFVLCNAATFAQSTDIDNPTVVTQSVIQGKNMTDETVVYYYTFTAGPGIVRITSDAKAVRSTPHMTWELSDANAKSLAYDDSTAFISGTRIVKEIKLDKKQKVFLKIVAETGIASFKFQLAGAVSFNPVKSGGNENIPEISGDTDTPSTQQICMPRNGVIIMTMQDGKKAKIDLSKVQKIEIQ